jgi:hypothetical protein
MAAVFRDRATALAARTDSIANAVDLEIRNRKAQIADSSLIRSRLSAGKPRQHHVDQPRVQDPGVRRMVRWKVMVFGRPNSSAISALLCLAPTGRTISALGA